MRLATLRVLPRVGASLLRGRPGMIAHFSAGLGDELMAGCVYRELIARRPELRLWVASNRPEIYRHLPGVCAVVPPLPRWFEWARRLGAIELPLAYTRRRDVAHEGDLSPPAHVLKVLMVQAGITGSVSLRPDLGLTEREKARFSAYRGITAIQASSSSAVRANPLKQYPMEQMRDVAQSLAQRGHRIVQVGLPGDSPLGLGEDLRGRLKIRDTAALLSQAGLFVGLEGGLMHLARAADCPSVIVFGGRQAPWQTGYAAFENLQETPPCSPCWGWTMCAANLACMTAILPSRIVAAAERQRERRREAPPDETVVISEAEADQLRSYLSRVARS